MGKGSYWKQGDQLRILGNQPVSRGHETDTRVAVGVPHETVRRPLNKADSQHSDCLDGSGEVKKRK